MDHTAVRARDPFGDVAEAIRDLDLDALAAPLAHATIRYLTDHAEELRRLSRAEPMTAEEAAALDSVGVETSAGPVEARPMVALAVRHATLLETAVPLAEAAARLGVSDGRLRQRIADRSLLAVRMQDGRSWAVPAFQLAGQGELPGLRTILRAVRADARPVQVAAFFDTAQPDLEAEDGTAMTPLDWLRQGGDPAPVRDLAAGI